MPGLLASRAGTPLEPRPGRERAKSPKTTTIHHKSPRHSTNLRHPLGGATGQGAGLPRITTHPQHHRAAPPTHANPLEPRPARERACRRHHTQPPQTRPVLEPRPGRERACPESPHATPTPPHAARGCPSRCNRPCSPRTREPIRTCPLPPRSRLQETVGPNLPAPSPVAAPRPWVPTCSRHREATPKHHKPTRGLPPPDATVRALQGRAWGFEHARSLPGRGSKTATLPACRRPTSQPTSSRSQRTARIFTVMRVAPSTPGTTATAKCPWSPAPASNSSSATE